MSSLLLNLALSHYIGGDFTFVYCYTLGVGYVDIRSYYKLKTLFSLTEGLEIYNLAAGANMLSLCGNGFNQFLVIRYLTWQDLRMQKNSVVI